VQVVGYEPSPDPALQLADGGEVERVPLEAGTELAYALGSRHCAGTVTDGVHEVCGEREAPYCPAHTRPRYFPEESEEEHAVYLAAFAPDVFKVGITKRRRLDRRLREQGADRAAHVFTVADGRIAREVEEDVDADSRLKQLVQVSEKRRGLGRPVDEAAWESLLADFTVHERFDLDYGFSLVDRPVPETLLSGTALGVQGRLLVLERGGTRYAVDLRDLLGYDLDGEGEGRALQSSLGAWG
jgi:hypothetical protein